MVCKKLISSYKSHSQDWTSYWFLLPLLCLLVVVRKYSKRSTKLQGMYLSSNYHVNFFFSVKSLLMFIARILSPLFLKVILSQSNLFLYPLLEAVKGVLFVLIGTFLVVCSLTPINWSCVSSGFKDFQPLMTFRDVEDTGLLWMYNFNNPPRPKKLIRNENC